MPRIQPSTSSTPSRVMPLGRPQQGAVVGARGQQAAPRGEDRVDDPFRRSPVGQQVDQSTGLQIPRHRHGRQQDNAPPPEAPPRAAYASHRSPDAGRMAHSPQAARQSNQTHQSFVLCLAAAGLYDRGLRGSAPAWGDFRPPLHPDPQRRSCRPCAPGPRRDRGAPGRSPGWANRPGPPDRRRANSVRPSVRRRRAPRRRAHEAHAFGFQFRLGNVSRLGECALLRRG